MSLFPTIIDCQFRNRLISKREANNRLSVIIDDRPNTTTENTFQGELKVWMRQVNAIKGLSYYDKPLMRYIDLSSMNSDKGSNSITQVPTYYIKSQTLLPNRSYTLPIKCSPFNPSNAEATFVQGKRT